MPQLNRYRSAAPGRVKPTRRSCSRSARFRGFPCILLGQDRSGQSALTTMGPAALREARRGMKLAEELQLPLVLVIDTLGASLSKEAEERGLAP